MKEHKNPIYKYCIVPECKNTTKNAPDKVFFLVPRGMDIRRKWCQIIKRDMISPSTPLYCCEDHFNIEEDTHNYMQYKIINLQENQNVVLRLKNGVVPHKFQCHKDTKSQPPSGIKVSLKQKHPGRIEEVKSLLPANQSDSALVTTRSSQNNYLEAGASRSPSSTQTREDNEIEKKSVPGCSTSLSNTNATSPLKIAQTTGIKRKLSQDDPADIATISSAQPDIKSSHVEGEMSSEVIVVEDDFLTECRIAMCMRTLEAVEKQPERLLGLPKRSYYVVKLLSENIPLPTIDILMIFKKIKLNEDLALLGAQFGYTQKTMTAIFLKIIYLLSEKMKELIIWSTPTEILNNSPLRLEGRYSNVVSIIDFLILEFEKPLDKVNKKFTRSQKCSTLKYLISCTPDGLVNFVSDGYRNGTSDITIVEESGFLERLPPDTAVMTDSDFIDISDLLRNQNCTHITLPSVLKFPNTRELSFYIDRVINRLKNYYMLLSIACVERDLMPFMDAVVVIACGLINTNYVLLNST